MSDPAQKIKYVGIDKALKPFEQFSKVALDAYVLLDSDGKITKANQLFSQLTGVKIKQAIKEKSLEDVILFKLNGVQLPIADFLDLKNPKRLDEVKAATKTRSNINLIMAIYPLINEQTNSSMGTFLFLRDVTAETNLQSKYKTTRTDSITDELSGLFTRRYFEDYLKLYTKSLEVKSTSASNDTSLNLCFIMIDIDNFKLINDTHGHLVGDKVIAIVGKILKHNCRKTDIVCRYGGEEFLIILQNTKYTQACYVAENLRKKIATNQIGIYQNDKLSITVSTGISQFLVNEPYTNAIKRADEALYTSKNTGRNKTHFHDGTKVHLFEIK